MTGAAADTIVRYAGQALASEPDASVWVAASAGSGKTKVLADRVLRLLLAGADPGKLLCLTFTRAAAAEMQNRIRALLGRWAIIDDATLTADLVRLTGEPPDGATMATARRLFPEILDAPGGLQIKTIHAFCESLLGRFPLEAGIPPHFEVMDERTAAEALEAARDDVLVAAQRDAEWPMGAALATVTGWVNEDDFATLMKEIAAGRGRLRRLIDAHGGTGGAVADLRAALGLAAADTRASVVEAACRDGAFDATGLRRATAALLGGTKTDRERGEKLAAWLEAPAGRVAGFENYAGAYIKKSDGLIFATLANKRVSEADPEVPAILGREAQRVFDVIDRCKAVATAEATAAILEVAHALIDRYEAYKRQHALLDYDDLILVARRLVEGATPWVLFKLDGGIDHILIDEAQDSNADQWAVVRAIADEFYAGEGAREALRTVFAVGDEKQSIFSFQGAAPAEFARMSAYFEARTTAADRRWERVPLDVSFRSAPAVLQAVDAVFAPDAVRDGVSGAEIGHKPHRRGQAGRVEVWPPVMPDERDARAPWTRSDARIDAGTPASRLAHAIAGRIDAWLRDGERLESANRPIRPGDILVLVRRRTDFVDEIIRELKKREIAVAGIDRMVLTDQLGVQDLIALGNFALLPQDDLNLACVLKGPLFGFTEDMLFALCYRRESTVWRALRTAARADAACAEAFDTLSDLLARADRTPPFEFFARILGPLRGRARIVARLREEANDPIDEFLALALDFERAHPPSLQAFLQWFAEGEAEIKRDLDQGVRDEVRVMTVHGSKGLQAPVVFLGDTMQAPRPGSGLLWDAGGEGAADRVLWPPRTTVRDRLSQRLATAERLRQDEEYRRLLYVAMTRAEDRLYVTGYGTRSTPPETCWYNLIRAGLDGVAETRPFESHGGGEWDRAELAWTGEMLVHANPQTSAPDRERPAVAAVEAPLPLPGWIDSSAPDEPEPPRPLAPSRPAAADPAPRSPVRGGSDAFQRGLLIHRLLQMLPDVDPVRRAAAARAYLSRPVHGLAAGAAEALLAETFAVLDNPAWSALFAPGGRSEAPVAGVVGETVISGRIDRLVFAPDCVKILDFKTNRPPPAREEDVPAAYLRQMAAYRALLSKIYADQRVECYLLWTHGPRLMPLSAQVMDAHAP